ncbi:MurR/RpiR family transcriptional regulator [Bosea psychrotolerans]|uniref:RpiR family transcriptional regulator n=1 Tax=Bosea psychrotolerans TaxID=1871628 RepID=A0A2S4MB21_9HYPH|nr:MurR/RpiR family transcriptional regulator [Bosea psychrotolerans]POR51932.1 RpiR family transcriptional regulator [Bosea psychrotolerans]
MRSITQDTVALLTAALRRLPPQQADAARFVIGRSFEAATMPMRGLARAAGLPPATFTRLAQSLGLPGWEELRAGLIADARDDLGARRPFSVRPLPEGGPEPLAGAMIAADRAILDNLDAARIEQAATLLEAAPRVIVAGFRSCHAPALLFHYQYRLFRPDTTLIGGVGGVLDVELGGLKSGDALVLFGFDPYSRDGLLCAEAAADAGAKVVAIVDRPDAPVAEGAAAVLTFGTDSSGFFPSLTGCIALVQALAATLYSRAGDAGREQLRRTEARIAAHTPYLETGPRRR